jgi:pimeloyl-ACP methyl ester carboxylesterase
MFARLMALLLVVVAVMGAVVWAPDRPVDELKARWAPAPSQFIEVRGMRMHVRDEGPRGDPHPIVLLHGTSASLHTWEGWVQQLKARHRVISLDLPGFGLTGPMADGDYKLPNYAATVLEVMDQLGVGRAVLAGNSFGGEVAWKVAVDAPQRVYKLVLVDSGGYAFVPKSVPLGFKLASMPALEPVVTHFLPRGAIESSVRSVYVDQKKVKPELIDRYYELTLRQGNRAALMARFAQWPIGAYGDEIKRVKAPTLVLWGQEDQLITPDWADRFVQDIPGSRKVVLGGLGHVPQEEDPVRSLQPVLAFIEEPLSAVQ